MTNARAKQAPEPAKDPVRGADWAVLALLAAVAAVSGFLEVMLVPLQVGTIFVPVSIALAVAGNVLLPRYGFALVRATTGALIPVVAWAIPVIGLVMITPPGGDVLVTGSGGQQWVYYLVVLLGGGTGMACVVVASAAVGRERLRQSGAVRVR